MHKPVILSYNRAYLLGVIDEQKQPNVEPEIAARTTTEFRKHGQQ